MVLGPLPKINIFLFLNFFLGSQLIFFTLFKVEKSKYFGLNFAGQFPLNC